MVCVPSYLILSRVTVTHKKNKEKKNKMKKKIHPAEKKEEKK